MAVPPEFIEDLRQRVPLSDIVGRRVKLVRKGRRFSGLCPFHSEKTPSFSVVDDDGFYHCFGCGAHGDAISFLREMDGLDFMEAVERLADMAGLSMPKSMQKINASWTCVLVDFFLILRANLVPKWRKVGSPKRIETEKPENVKKAPWLQPGLVFMIC